MTAPKRLLIPALVATLAGCAAITPERAPEQNAQHRLDRGLAAIGAGLYAEAFEDLAWVYSHCYGRQAASHALTALAALELDPRNAAARPQLGTELLGQVIQEPGAPGWVRPLAESAFLAALALGAPHPYGAGSGTEGHDHAGDPGPLSDSGPHFDDEPRVHPALGATIADQGTVYGCGRAVQSEGWVTPTLPTLPGPSMAELLASAQQRRDATVARADTLRQELALVKEQLTATRAELDRIRETLKP